MVLVASLYELSRPSSPSGLLHDSNNNNFIGLLLIVNRWSNCNDNAIE